MKFEVKELKTKLVDWVLNAHLPETFGMDESTKDEIKECFEGLVTKGILLKDGNRRGLKFKFNTDYKSDDDEILDDELQDAIEDITEETNEAEELKLNDIHVYVKERDSIKASVKSCPHSFEDLLQWVLDSKPDRDPSIVSTTLAIKKMAGGSVVMRVYAGVLPLIDEEFPSVESFTRAMKKLSKSKELKNVKE